MGLATATLSQHGYAILFAAVLVEAIGFPLPAALALLIAGALNAGYALGGAAAAMPAFA